MKKKLLRPQIAICFAWLAVSLMSVTAQAQQGDNDNGAEQKESKASPVAIKDGKVKLEPASTKIEFVGTHVGEDKKPRLGGFAKFEGEVTINETTEMVETIKIEIDITSVWTEFSKLTGHLKNNDFFAAEEFGTAEFESTEIESEDDGTIHVTGNLTLLGNTDEITFSGRSVLTEEGLILKTEFDLDRTQFGMDKMTGGVDKEVAVTVIVGEATSPKEEQDGNGSEKKAEKDDGQMEETTAELTTVSLKLPKML